MTNATNHADHLHTGICETGPRGKPVKKCSGCGCGIGLRKTYCAPCADEKREHDHVRIKRAGRAAKRYGARDYPL